ncbi:IS3 family transposase, partial [Vagococcus lutrae]
YYNKTRIQQKLGYKSPIEYRQSVTQEESFFDTVPF